MTLTLEAKEFIRNHAYLFDDGRNYEFFEAALAAFPEGKNILDIANYIQTQCEIDSTTSLLKLIGKQLIDSVEYYKNQPKSDDPSCGWSRLDWQLCGIHTFNLKHAQIIEYLDRHKHELGIELNPLEDRYGWQGDGDYDLGWFDKSEFDRLYSDEEWYS